MQGAMGLCRGWGPSPFRLGYRGVANIESMTDSDLSSPSAVAFECIVASATAGCSFGGRDRRCGLGSVAIGRLIREAEFRGVDYRGALTCAKLLSPVADASEGLIVSPRLQAEVRGNASVVSDWETSPDDTFAGRRNCERGVKIRQMARLP